MIKRGSGWSGAESAWMVSGGYRSGTCPSGIGER